MKTPHATTRRRRNPLAAFVLLAALTALAALGGCSGDNGPTAPAAANAASVQDGDLRLTVATDKASYAFGESVVITTTLANTGKAPLALDFTRGTPARYPNLNINVDTASGAALFVDGDGTADQTSLAAGASISYSFVWNQQSRLTRQPVDRGVYEVKGFTSFDNRNSITADGLFIELK